MSEVSLLTAQALLERAERLEGPPDLLGVQRRRTEQLLRTAERLASELADQTVEFEIAPTAAAAPAAGLYLQLSVFSGLLRVSIPDHAAALLIERWGEKGTARVDVPEPTRLSFLVALRCARHALGSRYGVRLLGAGEFQGADPRGGYSLAVTVKPVHGASRCGVWRIEGDEEIVRRLDWYANQRELAQMQARRGRFWELVVSKREGDESREIF